MAPEVSPPDNSLQPSQSAPDSFAVLTATAVGGIVAARMGRTPLALAAGAAALALLRKKQASPPPIRHTPSSSAFPPAPALASNPHPQIQQWLTRQIEREQDAATNERGTVCEEDAPDDDYQPLSLLLDDPPEETPSLRHSHYASLTEPPPACHQPPTSPIAEEDGSPCTNDFASSPSPSTAHFDQPPQPPLSGAGAAWLLGLEPLPSWTEAPSPTPTFTPSVFSGGSLPDEIVVPTAAPPPLAEENTDIHLLPQMGMSENVPEPIPPNPAIHENAVIAEQPAPLEVPEIQVQLASPGEASFDSPSPPQNPWHPFEDVHMPNMMNVPLSEAPPAPASPPVQASAIEAEIILRPRAPTNPSVIPKSTFPSASATQHTPPPVSPTPAAAPPPALPRAPIQSPREQQARPTWRSWWRGD